ncbi:conserved hypothetical protein [Neospora caninum Liverpool]|uniref:Uncharacterized protein n=1 Tax=Neospora caninum (strain Liverpool) TaxID=572307 RepID=F0VKI0_NEOCL|nr:conserved hypothetical protein [Neospora caninum Liverpool]CBZ54581.1 conserved hypothetical protein [Neospora caninum Liverpool]CEL69294.1 TPA: hypothetical protein BN1204_050090 [Neospora caninum Liverpool]|eukprot:XP_003884611.1 conserved hypothetical protein [Neospora caninum Liverpool]
MSFPADIAPSKAAEGRAEEFGERTSREGNDAPPLGAGAVEASVSLTQDAAPRDAKMEEPGTLSARVNQITIQATVEAGKRERNRTEKDKKDGGLETWHSTSRFLYVLFVVQPLSASSSPSPSSSFPPRALSRRAVSERLQEALVSLVGRIGLQLILAELRHFKDNLGIIRTDVEGAPSLLLALHQIDRINDQPCRCVLLRTSSVLGALAAPRRPAASLVLL